MRRVAAILLLLPIWVDGYAADSNWFTANAVLKQKFPEVLVFTSPTNKVVSQRDLRIQGFSLWPVETITYDLSNAQETVTGRMGYVRQSMEFGEKDFSSSFQCYDVLLASGPNNITLHFRAFGRAGFELETNLLVILDYSKAAPVEIDWPQNGWEICGSSFGLRGRVKDLSSTIAAVVTDINGSAARINGVVNREGTFWVDNLPLHDGSNTVILTVASSSGFSSSTNITVTHSHFVLTMDPVKGDLWLPTVNVSGYESDATLPVWVNGVKAKVMVNADGSGRWMAGFVPVSPGGVASFDTHAYEPDEIQPDGTYPDGRIAVTNKMNVASTSNLDNTTNQQNQPSGMRPSIINLQPVYITMSQSNRTFYFTWNTIPQESYQLQYSTDLNAKNWTNLGDPIVAISNSVTTTDDMGKDMHRFYRVRSP